MMATPSLNSGSRSSRITRWLIRATPLHVMLLIIVMSFATSLLPTRWTLFIRLFNGITLITLFVWGFIRFGQESRLYRDELRVHRAEIKTMLHADGARRSTELRSLQETATALALETANIAAALAHDTQVNADAAQQRMTTLSDQIAEGTEHARNAYHEANSINVKIDEQQVAIQGQQKALEALNERLLTQDATSSGESQLKPVLLEVLSRFDAVGQQQEEMRAILHRELAAGRESKQTTREQIDTIQDTTNDLSEHLIVEKKQP